MNALQSIRETAAGGQCDWNGFESVLAEARAYQNSAFRAALKGFLKSVGRLSSTQDFKEGFKFRMEANKLLLYASLQGAKRVMELYRRGRMSLVRAEIEQFLEHQKQRRQSAPAVNIATPEGDSESQP